MTHDKFQRPLNEQVREEAAEWLVAFCEGEVEASGRETFIAWLQSSPEHVRAYLRISALWEDRDLFARSRKLDAEALVRRALAESNVVSLSGAESGTADTSRTQRVPSQAAQHTGARRLAIAASVLLAAIGVASVVWLRVHTDPVYETLVGEQRTVTLSDGSTIAMNARSKVVVRYDAARRAVDLVEGQALFRVARNPARPFIVHSGSTSIRAVGTQFDVLHRPGKTVVTVVEGRVAVSGAEAVGRDGGSARASGSKPSSSQPRNATFVSAGEQIVATATALTAAERADVTAATAWTEGKLVFRSAPLREVIDEFNRHTPRRLIIDDERLAEVRISGMFPFTDTAHFVEFLRQRFAVTVRETDDEIRIGRH
jgi:transmembrane sensor